MNLKYRGADYEFEPSAEEMKIQTVEGLYRGHPFSEIVTHEAGDLSAIPFDLAFRGVAYHHAAEAAGLEISTQSLPMAKRPVLSERGAQAAQMATQHQKNILEKLQRRILSARAKGDQDLVHQLEAERRTLVR